jgi:hypothetical protein
MLISAKLDGVKPWLDPTSQVALGHILTFCALTGYTVGYTTDRLAKMGYCGQAAIRARTMNVEKIDACAFNWQLASNVPLKVERHITFDSPRFFYDWVDAGRPVPVAHLILVAVKLNMSLGDSLALLRKYGFKVTAVKNPNNRPTGDDRELIECCFSKGLPGSGYFPRSKFDAERFYKRVEWDRITATARHLNKSVETVVNALVKLEIEYEPPPLIPDVSGITANSVDDLDTVITSLELDGMTPGLGEEPVSPGHVVAAALRCEIAVDEIVVRLHRLGFQVGGTGIELDTVRPDEEDLLIVSLNLDGKRPWLSAAEVVERGHVLAAANRIGKPVEQVAIRLRRWGYDLPIIDAAIGYVEDEDTHLVHDPSRNYEDDRERVERLLADDASSATDYFWREKRWLADDAIVPLGHLLARSFVLERSVEWVAERLTKLGYNTAEVTSAASTLGKHSAVLWVW